MFCDFDVERPITRKAPHPPDGAVWNYANDCQLTNVPLSPDWCWGRHSRWRGPGRRRLISSILKNYLCRDRTQLATDRFGEVDCFRFLVGGQHPIQRLQPLRRSRRAEFARHFIVGIGFGGVVSRSEAVLQVIGVGELAARRSIDNALAE